MRESPAHRLATGGSAPSPGSRLTKSADRHVERSLTLGWPAYPGISRRMGGISRTFEPLVVERGVRQVALFGRRRMGKDANAIEREALVSEYLLRDGDCRVRGATGSIGGD